CYTVTVLLLVGSCWLFLGNADQLVPGERVESEAMRQWRTDDRPRAFDGGLWRDPAFWRSVNLTLTTSTLTALLAALVGIPAAYALSRYRVPGRRVIDVLFSSVIVLPASSVGLCLIVMFQYGPLYELQQGLGFRVAHTLVPGIVAAQLVLSLAMGMSAWRAAFDGVNPRFEQVARSLGSSPWRAFRTVTLPAAKTGLITGFILAWVRAMAEFGSVLIFCGTFRELPLSRFSPATQALGMHQADFLSVAMWSEIEYGNVEYGFGIGFALVAISAVSVYTIHRIGGKGYVW
ncbi:ABC transporter permease, partial [bacterium]|nr:ABC transporter permease [bacterium]